MSEARCFSCKRQREMVRCKEISLKNGKRAIRGFCNVCGKKMFKFAGKR